MEGGIKKIGERFS